MRQRGPCAQRQHRRRHAARVGLVAEATATRRDFITVLEGAEGAAIDPLTGDFLFSTFGGGHRIIVVRGFAPID